MKRSIFWSYLLLHSIAYSRISYGQSPISLADALTQAQTRRLEVTNQQLQTQLAESDEARRRANWLPQVTAGADFRWNTQIQRNIIRNAPFANGQVEQKLYDAPSRVERAINRANVELQQAGLDNQRIAVRQQVTEAYYQAVFDREKIRLSEQALSRAQGYLDQAKTRFDAGTLLKTDLDRFALDLRNAELTLRNDRRDYALSLDNLRYRINAPQPVVPADSLSALLTSYHADTLPGERVEIRQETISRTVNELNQQRELARLQPTVSAYGAYFAQQFADTFNPFQSGGGR